jgi:uncharacterized membrane protein
MSNSPLSILKFRIIFIICWAVMVADNIMVLNFFGLPWKAAIIDGAISNTLLLLACLLVMNTLRYYLPKGQQYINLSFSHHRVAIAIKMVAKTGPWSLRWLPRPSISFSFYPV